MQKYCTPVHIIKLHENHLDITNHQLTFIFTIISYRFNVPVQSYKYV